MRAQQGTGWRAEADVDPFLRQFFSGCCATHSVDGHTDDGARPPAEIIERTCYYNHLLGGVLRWVGIVTAGYINGLKHHVERLAHGKILK